MGWGAIITALLAVFGPLIAEWLRKWIDDRLRVAASQLPAPATFTTTGATVAALFDEAIALTPRRAVLRRSLLRVMRTKAVPKADSVLTGNFSLDASDELEVSELATGAAENE
jgi:hypothetical protein